MTTPSDSFGGPGGAYGSDRNPSGGGNDPFDRQRRMLPRGGTGFMGAPPPQREPFPFMFGVPTGDLVPNYMPQTAPMNPGNPQSVEQLYSMYGATPNAPMPITPNIPAPPPPPPQAHGDPRIAQLMNNPRLAALLSRFPQHAGLLGG